MRILVTGGLGYLGGRISKYLSEQNCFVLASSRQISAAPDWLQGRGRVVSLDLTDPKLDDVGELDAVVHLAALNEIDCAKNPIDAINVNTSGTLKLLMALTPIKPKVFMYFSTAHVYRMPLVGECREDEITMPIHPYAYSHKFAEDLVLAQEGKAFERAVIVRLSNGFGYPERRSVNRWTLLVNDLCQQVATTRRIKLLSDGTQERDFIPLSDVAAAVLHLLKADLSKSEGRIFNVGSGKAITVLEMATMVQKAAEKLLNERLAPIERAASSAVKVDLPKLDYRIDKLLATGFSPRANWEEEIIQTLRLCLS